MSFIIKRLEDDLELITAIDNISGFKYIPKNKKIKVKEVTIVNPDIIYALISCSFNKKYKNILEYYLKVISTEDEDSSCGALMMALDEIARLRTIIMKKYKKVLSKKQAEKFLRKLKILENEIRSKIIDFRLIKEANYVNTMDIEENKGISR